MKILYVTTISNTVNTFLIPHIKMLINEGHQVDVAYNTEQKTKNELMEIGCKVHEVPFQRSPLNTDNFLAYKILKKIVIKENYDLVHTHTPVASAIVRLVCRKLNNVRVFYTAHGFHFHSGAPLINWILFYPVEKWLARYTDVIITINQEDYCVVKNKFNVKKVEYVSGVGIEIEKFKDKEINIAYKKNEIGVPEESFVLLSVGELNKNKNHEVIIKAISKLDNPKIHYVVCGQGHLNTYLRNLSKELGVEKRVHLLGFRKDISEICRISDIFIFPSFREGLSVALMEAMGNKLPVVCSKIRGNVDLIENGKGGYLVRPNSEDDFAEYINKLILDDSLRMNFGSFNSTKIEKYAIKKVLFEMESIYKPYT